MLKVFNQCCQSTSNYQWLTNDQSLVQVEPFKNICRDGSPCLPGWFKEGMALLETGYVTCSYASINFNQWIMTSCLLKSDQTPIFRIVEFSNVKSLLHDTSMFPIFNVMHEYIHIIWRHGFRGFNVLSYFPSCISCPTLPWPIQSLCFLLHYL